MYNSFGSHSGTPAPPMGAPGSHFYATPSPSPSTSPTDTHFPNGLSGNMSWSGPGQFNSLSTTVRAVCTSRAVLTTRQPDTSQNGLALRVIQLTEELAAAKAALQATTSAYDTLMKTVQDAIGNKKLAPSLSPSPLQKSFPHARFWNKAAVDDWVRDGNGKYGFVVDSNGLFIGDGRVTGMVEQAKHIFQEMRRVQAADLPPLCPPAWGDAGIYAVLSFVNAIEALYPELTLCEDHWKARQVAAQAYKDWSRRRGKSVKNTEDTISTSTKRPRASSSSPSASRSSTSGPQHDEDDNQSASEDEGEQEGEREPANKRVRISVSTSPSQVFKVPQPRVPMDRARALRALQLMVVQIGDSSVKLLTKKKATASVPPPTRAQPLDPTSSSMPATTTATNMPAEDPAPRLPSAPPAPPARPSSAGAPSLTTTSPPPTMDPVPESGTTGHAQSSPSASVAIPAANSTAAPVLTPTLSLGPDMRVTSNPFAGLPRMPTEQPKAVDATVETTAGDGEQQHQQVEVVVSTTQNTAVATASASAQRKWKMYKSPKTAEMRVRMNWATPLPEDARTWEAFEAWLKTEAGKKAMADEKLVKKAK
ncbi:hypothetical protein EXIGLDRAFT_701568 [Exidia glandulosa HHB12029]|uniref:Uncharacterized protein n=1 Tax=Exidia glandulosa HHB12029 TaxID=1314781 RepID=A0A165Q1C7_EXIGL|nr:hypothetical protein EXIGLDRAFT_701568 [Exidia glandulosa HHB12029]